MAGYYAPHETRMLSLEMAVEFVNGDARKSSAWKAEEVIVIARVFEDYLTEEHKPGFESLPTEEETSED